MPGHLGLQMLKKNAGHAPVVNRLAGSGVFLDKERALTEAHEKALLNDRNDLLQAREALIREKKKLERLKQSLRSGDKKRPSPFAAN